MLQLNFHPAGRHQLSIPGPSPVPDRILRAMSMPTIDHRGPEFAKLGFKVLADLKKIFKTEHPVIIYPASGTGAWEAALCNVLSPGDQVLMYETGQFATLWKKMADRLGVKTEFIGLPGLEGWRRGVQADLIEARLKADTGHAIKAVCVVHNETSTGVTSNIAAVRAAIDAAGHPALLMVDTISGLASADYRHDEWGVDVTVSGSQKGLMLPPGLSFNAVSAKAIEASKSAKLTRAFWGWDEMIAANATGYFPYTPATNLLYGLSEALDMMAEEGLDNVFARHERLAKATRAAVAAWGLDTQCADARGKCRQRLAETCEHGGIARLGLGPVRFLAHFLVKARAQHLHRRPAVGRGPGVGDRQVAEAAAAQHCALAVDQAGLRAPQDQRADGIGEAIAPLALRLQFLRGGHVGGEEDIEGGAVGDLGVEHPGGRRADAPWPSRRARDRRAWRPHSRPVRQRQRQHAHVQAERRRPHARRRRRRQAQHNGARRSERRKGELFCVTLFLEDRKSVV